MAREGKELGGYPHKPNAEDPPVNDSRSKGEVSSQTYLFASFHC